jgi:hypothetical protein
MGFRTTGNSIAPPPTPSLPDYSLSEQIYFRKWIDGSDIYEKTIPVRFTDNTPSSVVDYILDIDWIIDVGFSVKSGGYMFFLSSHQIEQMTGVSISVWVDGNEVRLMTTTSIPSFLLFDGYLFLRYTKKKKKM